MGGKGGGGSAAANMSQPSVTIASAELIIQLTKTTTLTVTGGAGSAIGASLGALIMGMAYIGIPFSQWDSDWTSTFLGIILFSAVMINTYIGSRAKGGKK